MHILATEHVHAIGDVKAVYHVVLHIPMHMDPCGVIVRQVEEHRAAANKVAEHWKAEAKRQEAAAAAAQAPQTQVIS